MATFSTIVADCFVRWRQDLREVTAGVFQDPFAQGRGRRWERDFFGEVNRSDINYAVFITVLSLAAPAIVAYTSASPQIDTLLTLFRAPLLVALSGFLSSSIIYLGAHLNRNPKSYATAFKLMLRLMSLYPILNFLLFWKYGEPLQLLVFGFFLIRGVRKTYTVPLQNALLFYGLVYFTFAMMQLQAVVSPPSGNRFEALRDYDSSLPPSHSIMRTSSTRRTPH